MTAEESLPLEIDVRGVKRLLDTQVHFLLLDCREQVEYEYAHLQGAVWIPMGQLPGRMSELSLPRDQRIVVYCHLGSRSFQVTHWLRCQGFPQAQNMMGGIEAWSLEIDPSVPRYR